MASKNKLIAVKYGHKTIGIYIFFSIAGIRRLGDIIAHIQHNDNEAKELAIRDLIHLHNKLVAAIISNEDSVFAHEQVKYYEIDNQNVFDMFCANRDCPAFHDALRAAVNAFQETIINYYEQEEKPHRNRVRKC